MVGGASAQGVIGAHGVNLAMCAPALGAHGGHLANRENLSFFFL